MAGISTRLSAALADRYRLERELGQGGMATVYLARDLRHERDVALKVMRPELAAVIGAERFLTEIRTTANLQHPHILPLHDSGSVDGTVFYVMPFIDGETLRDRLDREQQLPVADAVRIASQVASALDYAHRQGVIHRDIKPENILLHDGSALVADFGIALAASQTDGGTRMTETGMSLGTPMYMSPEQAMGERAVDARTDIYALGCVLYEALAGEPPFTGPTAQAIVARVMTEGPRPLATQRSTVPPNVNAAVSMALAKLPADRFATAAAFAAALADANFRLAGDEVAERPAATYWTPRRVVVLAGAAAIAIIAGVLLGRGLAPSTDADRLSVKSVILPPDGEDFSTRRSFGALSPDGQRFAFVTISARGQRQLWIRRLDTLAAERVEGTLGARSPFWSPDGASIGFLANDRLQRIDLASGTVSLLCEVQGGQAGAWTRGDLIVVATQRGIERARPGGGGCDVVIPSDAGGRYRNPSLTDDGRHVLFDRRNYTWGASTLESFGSVAIADLESGTITDLASGAWTPTFVAPNHVLYGVPSAAGLFGTRIVVQSLSRDRMRLEGEPVAVTGALRNTDLELSYSASTAGTLVYLPSRGDPEKLLVNRAGVVLDTVRQREGWTHRVARQHRWVAVSSTLALWLYDLDRNTSTPLITSAEGGFPWNPVWAPDDRALAFGACSYGRTDDLPQRMVTVSDSLCQRITDWTADGRALVIERRTPGRETATVALWDTADSTTTPLFEFTGINGEAVISPDGRQIAYVSSETGIPEVYVRPFRAGGRAVRITTDGARTPHWRRDGREFYYQTADGRLMAMAVPASGDLTAATTTFLFRAPSYVRTIFYDRGTPYDVTPDGQQFVLRAAASDNHAVLVQHWQAMLKSK